MSGFSNFLTNFSGGARIRSSDSSYNDLMSQAIFVPSLNTTVTATGSSSSQITSYHTTDGFIYLSNLLIQFSATNYIPPNNNNSNALAPFLASNTVYTFSFPINTASSITSPNPFTIMLSGNGYVNPGNNSNNPIVTLAGFNGSNFNVNFGNAAGNFNWVSIGLAPTVPIYTYISNSNITVFSDTQNLIYNWVTMNLTGKLVYLCNNTPNIYKNQNYGYGSWTSFTESGGANITGVACDQSGKYVCAIIYNTSNVGIRMSTDYGSTFTNKNIAGGNSANSVACSYTGQYFYISSSGGGMYYSNDYGTTFSLLSANLGHAFYAVATSELGNYLYITSTGGITRSSNYGSTLTYISIASGSFNAITTSSTGQYVAVVQQNNGSIYISSTYGSTWRIVGLSLTRNWISITSNSTGQYLSAVNSNIDYIYYSTDYGNTWSVSDVLDDTNTNVSINMNYN